MKIAIIDDEQPIIDMIALYLNKKNRYNISTYTNPKNALVDVKRGIFDLVLLDINMPYMNGIDFLKQIKETDKTQKIIMMTAQSSEDKMIFCQKLGVHDYITKPFISLRDVENKILDVLENR